MYTDPTHWSKKLSLPMWIKPELPIVELKTAFLKSHDHRIFKMEARKKNVNSSG
jgi:hypothetical protein